MGQYRFATSRLGIIATLLLLGSGSAAAQEPEPDVGDEFGLGEEEGPAEEAPSEPPAEGEPAPYEGGVDSPPVEPAPVEEAPVEELPVEELPLEELPPEEALPPPPPSAGEIIVTGSRIKRSNFAQPSAVQVVDRKQLEMSGADNMADVVRNMNINAGSDLNTDVSSGSPGAAQFNLRGLGVSSTLVLLNGRRMPLSGAATQDGSGFVDINAIPVSVIERLEVLKGGASAIYGSDAVAGVVNIITRKRMDGFEAEIGAQTTDDFDHHEWDASLIGGAMGERTRLTAALSYFKREPLAAADRDFTDNGINVSALGWPSVFLELGPDFSPVGAYQDPGCRDAPLSAPTTDPMAALPFCTFNFNPFFQLMVDEQRVNAFATIEHDLSDHTMAFAEASYSRSRVERELSPAYPILSPILIPADHRYNPTGNTLRWYGRVAGGASPPYDYDYDSDTLHTVAGIGGDFGGFGDAGADWEWEIAGTWSGNRYQVFAQDVLTDPLQRALNSCGPGADPADCWNPFSFGPPNSQAIIDRVTGELRTKVDTELTTLTADITGPLFELPGGDLSLAVGGQVRRETAVSNPDHDSNQEAFIFLVGGPDWEADRRILAAYGELLLPLFEGFELQAAGRFEDYENIGSSVDPMLGVSWTPAKTFMGAAATKASQIRLRGTYATSFRAPSLLQMNGAITELLPTFDVRPDAMGNPMQAMTATYLAVRTTGNPDLKPQSSKAITGGLEWAPIPELMFEADYWNYTYEDIIVKENHQQIVAADFADQNDPKIIRDPDTGIPQRINVSFINAQEVFTHGIDFGVMVRTQLGSAGTLSVAPSGSYVLAYEIPQSAVSPDLWDEDFTSCDAPSAPKGMAPPAGANCDVAGLRNSASFARSLPRLRATLPVSWNLEAHTAALIVNFIGSYRDDADLTTIAGEQYADIDAFPTIDMQYSFRLEETEHMATTFKIGVVNLLDSDPPAVNAGYGYDVRTHDPRGRLLYGRLIQEF